LLVLDPRTATGAVAREEDGMGNPVTWFEVTGRDGAKLQRFYSELFDWKIDANNPFKYGLVDTGGGIGGGVGPTSDGSAGATTFYVETDDVAGHLKRAEAAGGKIVMDETEVMEGTVVGLFTDPEGHQVGLLKASQS
jgi:predicted enzyme related to lactoylglutathione lyase